MKYEIHVNNNQDAFNKAARGVLLQGCASVSDNGSCLYDGPHGTACGIGWLLDPVTRGEIDNESIGDLLAEGSVVCYNASPALLQHLQDAHDCAYQASKHNGLAFIPLFIKNMESVAESFEFLPQG